MIVQVTEVKARNAIRVGIDCLCVAVVESNYAAMIEENLCCFEV